MNWRGRPLASHEVVVNTIAATTTRTGLKVRAELDDGQYPTGAQVSDAQMKALPLDRHDWHGDWNYTLRPDGHGDWARAFRPRGQGQPPAAPDPFDQPSPALAWLRHPALTGLPAAEWNALIATLVPLYDQQREAALESGAATSPGQAAPGPGRRPVLTLADRLLAAILHTVTGCPKPPSPPCSASGPRPPASAAATSASSWNKPGMTIHPAPNRLACPRRPLRPGEIGRVDYPSQDQTSVLFTCKL